MDRKALLEGLYRRSQEEGPRWSKAEIQTLWEAFLELFEEVLEEKGSLTLTGLGTFKTVLSPPRKGYDFKKQKTVSRPGKVRITFRPSRALKASLGK